MKKRLLTVLSVILTFLMIGSTVSFGALVDPVDPENFTDVTATDWFKEYVDVVASKGYMIGTSATTFEPNTELTRAMFATILARYNGDNLDDSKKTVFDDVAVGEWFTGSIAWCNESGVVQGYGGGKFGPTDSIKRGHLALMICRYIKYYEGRFGKIHKTDNALINYEFADINTVTDPEEKEAIETCVDYGLINGYPEESGINTFRPARYLTRAEAAAIISRLSWIAPPPTERYYKVVAELTPYNDPSLAISLSSQKHTVTETGLFADKLAEEIFSDSNTASISSMMDYQMGRIHHYHNPGVVTVGDDNYNVEVNRDGNDVVLTAEKNGVAVTAAEWNEQLDAEEILYNKRVEDFAAKAGLTEAAKTAWNEAAAEFAPTKLLTVESDGSLVLLSADEYAKAIQTAGIKLGIVAKEIGGDFTGWKNLKEYLTDPNELAIKEPDKDKYSVQTETIQNALADENNVLIPFVKNELPYTVGEASGNYKGITLNLINLYTSRNYAAEPENVSSIVAILKAIEMDTNTPYLGKYEVKVTVQEVK